MDDPFEVLGLPRRPAVDESALRAKYLELAARWHPDAGGGDAGRFQQVRAAYEILSDPASRLRALLPAGAASGGAMPDADLFSRVGAAVQAAKSLADDPRARASGLAAAVFEAERADALNALRAVRAEVDALHRRECGALDALDRSWPDVSAGDLAAVAARLRFSARWLREVDEWEFRLSQGAPAGRVGP